MHSVRIEYQTSQRGYVLTLERDLLGDFVLCRRWFGLTNRRGGVKHQILASEDEAIREIDRVRRLRARRGYQTHLVEIGGLEVG